MASISYRSPHRTSTMHNHQTPPVLRPPCNAPMALDRSFSRTRGLEPELAKLRNRRMVETARTHTVGPMPVRDFMHDFLYVPHPCEMTDLLASRQAFCRVPSRATASDALCRRLVSTWTLLWRSPPMTPARTVISIEQAHEIKVKMSWVYFSQDFGSVSFTPA